MRRPGENRMQMVVDPVDGSVHPDDDVDVAEPVDVFAAEDAARERALKRMPSMSIGGRVAAPWKQGAA